MSKTKLAQETIEEIVAKTHMQCDYLIETMLRSVIADFESSDSEDCKLALTIEVQRKRGGGTLTIQTKGQSSVDLKRKDQTPAATIDYGPTLPFDKEEGDLPDPPAEDDGYGHPRLLKAAPKLLKAADVEVTDTDAEDGDEPEAGDEPADTPED